MSMWHRFPKDEKERQRQIAEDEMIRQTERSLRARLDDLPHPPAGAPTASSAIGRRGGGGGGEEEAEAEERRTV